MGKTTITLASGYEMPLVGLGIWKVPREKTEETVYNAVKVGCRLFDGAYDYGNEAEAGKGLRRAIEDGLVKREELFLTTKLWNTYHRKEIALDMAKKQNETWGLGYIDLYLIHFPVSLKYVDPAVRPFPGWTVDDKGTVELEKVPIRETWEALETIVDQGIARSIGVSNFQAQSITDLASYARHPISSLQIEHHPYLVQKELVAVAREHGAVVTAYSSFGPMGYEEMTGTIAERARGSVKLVDAEPVKAAAAKHGVTPPQVLLRWATQRGVAVIPKSNSAERLRQNLESNNFDLSREELDAITALDRGFRFNNPADTEGRPIYIW